MVGRYEAAAVCTPGFEELCSAELTALGCRPKPGGPGTIEFSATARQLYLANVWLRTASRVMVGVAKFRATDFPHLEAAVARVDWAPWLGAGIAPKFRVSVTDSKLYHTKAIAERLHKIVGPPAIQGQPEQLIVVRINRNTVTIRIDASGEALYLRPWRSEVGPAPLRPTMAAAMLALAGWDGTVNFLDPFCGSGVIAIEAALMANRMPPGGQRSFAFQDWADFEPGTWASVAGSIAAQRCESEVELFGSDRDAAQIERAKANAERAGVKVDFETVVVSHLKALPGPGLVVTNPPFGKRIGDGRLDGLYKRFGAVMRERLADWDLTLLCPQARLAKLVDADLSTVAQFRHGGTRVSVRQRQHSRP